MSINKIIIRGKETTMAAVSASRGDNKNITVTTSLVPEAVYELGGSDRDIQQEHMIELDDKLLEFTFDDGTTWMCDAATLHELYPEAESMQRDGGGFVIPATLNNISTRFGFDNLSHLHPKFTYKYFYWTTMTENYKIISPTQFDFMYSLLSFLYRSFSVGSLSKCHWTTFLRCLLCVFIVLSFRAKLYKGWT